MFKSKFWPKDIEATLDSVNEWNDNVLSLLTAFKMMEEVYAENASDAYRIMCVGDSITHGYINGDNGYRKYLCHYLAQDGISYDMVGPENNWI